MSQMDDFAGGVFIGVVVMGFISVVIAIAGSSAQRYSWQREAVKNGAAEYDQQTGEWRWKVKVEDE
jgi:hypothetical protein